MAVVSPNEQSRSVRMVCSRVSYAEWSRGGFAGNRASVIVVCMVYGFGGLGWMEVDGGGYG